MSPLSCSGRFVGEELVRPGPRSLTVSACGAIRSLSSADARSSARVIAAKCDLHNRERTVCCRDLKSDDERHLVDPDIVRDIIM